MFIQQQAIVNLAIYKVNTVSAENSLSLLLSNT